jgi:hypothetical protein
MASEQEINGGVGLCQQIKILGGIMKRISLSPEHAKAALRRVVGKIPPSGVNNEQVRDCCIWEVAFELSSERLCTW